MLCQVKQNLQRIENLGFTKQMPSLQKRSSFIFQQLSGDDQTSQTVNVDFILLTLKKNRIEHTINI